MKHLDDAELMAVMDGEAGGEHLKGCSHCRARYRVLARALEEFTAMHRASSMSKWRYAAAAAMLIVGLGIWWSQKRTDLPNASFTPGATRPMTQQQVCVALAQDDERTAPRDMAAVVFTRYGIKDPKPKAYEVDYLITPALGGAEDVKNLWPQPYAGSVWNARVKDALEDYLRTMVCTGRLELATAQEEIAGDWIAAYRKYFRTDAPLPAHAQFVKDRAWE